MKSVVNLVVIICIFNIQDVDCRFFNKDRIQKRSSLCSNADNEHLIELFFKVVFKEFQANPPVCVCTQMCKNHDIICFPSGCSQSKNNVSFEPQNLDKDKATLNFESLMRQQNKKILEVNKLSPETYLLKHKTNNEYGLRDSNLEYHRNIVQKLGLKYKKKPPLEFFYNFRENVLNKFNKIKYDVSYQRWPKQTHYKNDNKINIMKTKENRYLKWKHEQNNQVASYKDKSSNSYRQFKRGLDRMLHKHKSADFKQIFEALGNDTFNFDYDENSLVEIIPEITNDEYQEEDNALTDSCENSTLRIETQKTNDAKFSTTQLKEKASSTEFNQDIKEIAEFEDRSNHKNTLEEVGNIAHLPPFDSFPTEKYKKFRKGKQKMKHRQRTKKQLKQ